MFSKRNILTSHTSSIKIQKTALFLLCILIPLFIGLLSASLTADNYAILEELNKPPLYPPGILFSIVWSILYLLMGIASYLVLLSHALPNDIIDAISVYCLQLGINFFWSIFFFNLQAFFFSFLWLVLLWILIALTLYNFSQVSKTAARLMLPYLLWVTFAGYLNFYIFLFN